MLVSVDGVHLKNRTPLHQTVERWTSPSIKWHDHHSDFYLQWDDNSNGFSWRYNSDGKLRGFSISDQIPVFTQYYSTLIFPLFQYYVRRRTCVQMLGNASALFCTRFRWILDPMCISLRLCVYCCACVCIAAPVLGERSYCLRSVTSPT